MFIVVLSAYSEGHYDNVRMAACGGSPMGFDVRLGLNGSREPKRVGVTPGPLAQGRKRLRSETVYTGMVFSH